MINLLLISLLVLTTSTITYAEDAFPKGRTSAVHTGDGNDPNGDGSAPVTTNTTQAGYTKPGKDPSEQVPICEHCQDQNLFLTQVKKQAPNYVPKPSDTSSPTSNQQSDQ